MADNKNLEMLQKGVETWNNWYRECCDQAHSFRAQLAFHKPDLSSWDGDFLPEFDWHRFCFHERRFPHEIKEAHERYEQGKLSVEEIREGWVHLDGIELGSADLRRTTCRRFGCPALTSRMPTCSRPTSVELSSRTVNSWNPISVKPTSHLPTLMLPTCREPIFLGPHCRMPMRRGSCLSILFWTAQT
jgi:hypothetical protein